MWLASTGGGWSMSWAVARTVIAEVNTRRTSKDRGFTIELLFATWHDSRALSLMIPMVIDEVRRETVGVFLIRCFPDHLRPGRTPGKGGRDQATQYEVDPIS